MLVNYNKFQQCLSALNFVIFLILGEPICVILYMTLMLYGGWFGKIVCVLYFLYFIKDGNAAVDGRRRQGFKFARSSLFWHHFRNYFPLELVKTAELLPNRNYLIASFPHGILSVGAFGNFTSSITGFNDLYPGICSKMCTMNYHFYVPFFRDILLSLGMISVSRKSILNALTFESHDDSSEYKSNAAVIVVGGYRELLNTKSKLYKLVLKNRKGFIKLALETGAAIVPSISFGEVDLFDSMENSILLKLQMFITRYTAIPLPMIRNIMPRRRPIVTVVGAPIDVNKSQKPSQWEVDELHLKFCAELEKLFHEHKLKYYQGFENVQLLIE